MYGHCGKPALMNDDGHKFMMSSSFDFMRYPDGTAKITDDRNDNSKILSQITLVCIRGESNACAIVAALSLRLSLSKFRYS